MEYEEYTQMSYMRKTAYGLIILGGLLVSYNATTDYQRRVEAAMTPSAATMTPDKGDKLVRGYRDGGHPEAHQRADAALLQYIGIPAVTDAFKQMGRD